MKITKWLTPAFLLAVLLLGLGELGARLFFARDISGRFDYGYSPDAGFDEGQDGLVRLFRAGGRRFHPQSFQKRRPPGTFRVMVIGDSVPRGPSFKEAYPYLLETELKRHAVQAESLNLAVPGYGARRCQVVLRKVLEFEPSLIILHVNDSNKYEDDREFRRSQEFKTWHPRNWPMKVFIFRRLYEAKTEKVFWRLLPDQMRLKFAAQDPDAWVAANPDPEEMRQRMRLARETTRENAVLAQAHGAPLLLITQCRLVKNGPRSLRLDDHGLDALGRSLAGEGVYHLAMKEVFAPLPDAASFFSDSGHLKPSGHLLLARAIVRKMQDVYQQLGLTALKPRAKGDG
jgi:hypothetical protein